MGLEHDPGVAAHYGKLNIFQPTGRTKFFTGVYVFAINPDCSNPEVRFAFGRKVPPKCRKGGLKGAAGTKPKYHGKWTSLGGGSDRKARTPLQAAVIELNDEANIASSKGFGFRGRLDPREDVYVNFGRPGRPAYAGQRLRLIDALFNRASKIDIFTFEMPAAHWKEFMWLFPDVSDEWQRRGGQPMVTASHGEIDWTASFTIEQIVYWQQRERSSNDNNYFTYYTLKTFGDVVLPAVEKHLEARARSQTNSPIAALLRKEIVKLQQGASKLRPLISPDVTPRKPNGWRDGRIYN